MSYIPDILLVLFILNLGTAFGAGLYETKIIIPQWFQKSNKAEYYVNTEAMRELDTGRKFWAFVTTGPLTLITLANLFVAWPSQPPYHTWWLAAVLLTLIERIGTFTFFIPTAIKLQQAEKLPADRVARLAGTWIGLNYVRNALNLVAWLLALVALAL